ncbi:MAG: FAD-binding protein [Ilumatobacteraceae bacterium]|jgi:L-gulono-1,4-lactone dehydrogenase|nr:FAD-binding protein [Ilumatobacteraceae bacterium]
MATWRNWAGNQKASPLSIESPRSVGELAALVASASELGQKVKAVGSGHSFTSAAATNGRMVRLESLSGILNVDRAKCQVTVGAGTRLSDLNTLLHSEGLALANLGDIAYQTVAGAISTSTHGTGKALTGLAGQVIAMKLINGQGEIIECSKSVNPQIFDVARVSVGALGIITEYTLQAVPSFRLRALEQPMRLDDVLENAHDLASTNDHFEFFWIPHTKWALTKRNNRTEDELQPLPRVKGWIEKTFMENYAFGAVCRVGRARPSLIPRLATALPSSGSREYVDQSYKIFASPRIVRFYEMEHALPVEALVPALKEIRAMVDRKGYLLNFPVEVRFTKGDDVPLSTAYGRDSAYIAVHVYKGMECEPFFRDVEDILRAYDARPHWGKMHYRDAEELSKLYPRWDEFITLRNQLDPQRTFSNAYSDTVFGK